MLLPASDRPPLSLSCVCQRPPAHPVGHWRHLQGRNPARYWPPATHSPPMSTAHHLPLDSLPKSARTIFLSFLDFALPFRHIAFNRQVHMPACLGGKEDDAMRIQHPTTINEAARLTVEGMTEEERSLLRGSCRRTVTMLSNLYLGEVVRYRMLDHNPNWNDLHHDFHASCKADGIDGHIPFGEHGGTYIVLKAWEKLKAEGSKSPSNEQVPASTQAS